MHSFNIIAVALLAALSAATPIGTTSLNLETRAANCTEYASVDAGEVCIDIPSDCAATYIVQSGDTCQAIAKLFSNFTLSQFYYWNPDVGQGCTGLRAYVPVCIDTPWYHFVPPVFAAGGTVVPASAVPVPIMPEIVSSCTKFEYIDDSGIRVDTIVAQNNITMNNFLAWNQYVDPTNPYVWAEYWVCVGSS